MSEQWSLVLEFFFSFFFFDHGLGSWSAAWASRVDVVWVSVCDSSLDGCWSYVWWCCIHVALYASCMYPHVLCNVDNNDIHLAKAFQYAVLSLVGPSSLFRIVSHIGRDKLVSEPRPTIGAPLFDRVVWPLSSLEEKCFRSLVISESRNSFYSSAPLSLCWGLLT